MNGIMKVCVAHKYVIRPIHQKKAPSNAEESRERDREGRKGLALTHESTIKHVQLLLGR